MSILLYLDRFAINAVAPRMIADLEVDQEEFGRAVGSFFLAYALMQVPAGWMADRLGSRKMLTLYVVGWSLCTIGIGLVNGLLALFVLAQPSEWRRPALSGRGRDHQVLDTNSGSCSSKPRCFHGGTTWRFDVVCTDPAFDSGRCNRIWHRHWTVAAGVHFLWHAGHCVGVLVLAPFS